MPRVTGIQILENGIRAVELKGSLKKPRLSRIAEIPVAEGGDAEEGTSFGEALRGMLGSKRIARDPAVLALPSLDFKIRSLSVPFKGMDQIRKVIRTVMEEHLHGLPIENALVVFHKVRDLDGISSRVLTFAVEKNRIGTVLKDLQDHGVDPQAVETDLSALYSFADWAGAFPEEGTALVIDLESHRTGILMVRDRRLTAVRAFRLNLPGTPPEAGETGEDGARPAPAEGEAMADRGAEVAKLAREIDRTLEAEGLNEDPASVFVTGGASTDQALIQALREKTGLALEPLPVPPSLAEAPPWAGPCLGVALKLMGHDPLRFDFRQEQMAFRRKFERVRVGLTALSILAFLLFGVLGAHFYRLYNKERDRHRALADKAWSLYHQARPRQKPPKLLIDTAADFLLKDLKKRMEDLTGKGVDKDIPQIESALSRWRDVAIRIRSTGEEISYLTVSEFHLTPKWITIKGEVDSPESVDSLLNVIRSNPGFEKAAFGTPPKLNKEGRYSFHIHGEIGS